VKPSRALVGKVRQVLRRLGLSTDGMVVAVSGGADSLALLRVLAALRSRSATGPLVIAHLNHQLRGSASDCDEAFVRDLHTSMASTGITGLELCCERIDVAARARGENLEAVARRIRYGWLVDVARARGLGLIATGHTADDQAETVLHRLLRGTGVQGLRGIAARRVLEPGIVLVRPLLTATRADVLAYLKAEGQAYREDTSNADLRFTRNRIRHELIPHLARHYNPAVTRVLCRLAEQAAAIHRDTVGAAQQLLQQAELPRADRLLILARNQLATAPRHLVREVFRLVWAREGWPMAGMHFDHWDRLAGVARGETTAVDLPGGIEARRRENVVQVGPAS
jgi:tRNA(Ile)-lysidine synthase